MVFFMLRFKITTELVSTILGVTAGVFGILAGVLGILPSCEKNDNVVVDNPKSVKVEATSYSEPEIKKLPSSSPALQPSIASPTSLNE